MVEPAHHAIETLHRSLSRLLQDGDAAASPIRAGMRARAIADTCETLGLAAVLIDGTGRVLHVGAATAALLGDDLELAAGHLVGLNQHSNRAVQQAVTSVINGEAAEVELDVDATRTIAGLPYHDPSPFQRLSGVLVLLENEGAKPRLAALRTMLTV